VALTDAACYLLDKLAISTRKRFLREIFDPVAMGLNTCRVCIGASDYAVELYSYDEGSADPDLARFSIDHDRAYIPPILKEVRELCPELFLVASPWSPPGWMKVGGSMAGDRFNENIPRPTPNIFGNFWNPTPRPAYRWMR
jgi:glucosylceramidase